MDHLRPSRCLFLKELKLPGSFWSFLFRRKPRASFLPLKSEEGPKSSVLYPCLQGETGSSQVFQISLEQVPKVAQNLQVI